MRQRLSFHRLTIADLSVVESAGSRAAVPTDTGSNYNKNTKMSPSVTISICSLQCKRKPLGPNFVHLLQSSNAAYTTLVCGASFRGNRLPRSAFLGAILLGYINSWL